ncbi:MAG: hypothetical protein ACLQGT_07810 [Terracidiphilus sp.]
MVFHAVHRADATREKTQPRQNNEHNGAPAWRNLHRCESGQTITVWLGAIVVMSSVLMGSAYDMSVAWMHKQWADTAAQAACTAGAMDMLWAANKGIPSTPVTAYNFLSSTSGDCATSSSNAMCYYAKLNGYASPGLTSNAPSNDVSWSMSTTQPTNSNSSPALTTTPSNGVPAYMNVAVTENVPVTFMGIFAHFLGMKNSWNTIQVAGHCNCGLEGTATTGSPQTIAINAGTIDEFGEFEPIAAVTCWSDSSCSVTSSPLIGPNDPVPINTVVTVTAYGTARGEGNESISGSVEMEVSCNGGSTWNSIDTVKVTVLGSSPLIGSASCTVSNTNQIELVVAANLTLGSAGPIFPTGDSFSVQINDASITTPGSSTTSLHVTSFQND